MKKKKKNFFQDYILDPSKITQRTEERSNKVVVDIHSSPV